MTKFNKEVRMEKTVFAHPKNAVGYWRIFIKYVHNTRLTQSYFMYSNSSRLDNVLLIKKKPLLFTNGKWLKTD